MSPVAKFPLNSEVLALFSAVLTLREQPAPIVPRECLWRAGRTKNELCLHSDFSIHFNGEAGYKESRISGLSDRTSVVALWTEERQEGWACA